MKKWFLSVMIFLLLLLMLCFPKETLYTSRNGLDLWFGTLVPTLLPFLILSGFLVHSGLVQNLAALLYPVLGRLFALSLEGCYALFAGFLCGYPVGAKILGDLLRNRKIHPEEARYLLGFCNNVSPSFVITFLVFEKLNDPSYLAKTLLLLYGFPICYGLFTRNVYLKRKRNLPDQLIKNASEVRISFELLDACIYDAVNTLLKIGGYVILFSVLAGIPAKISLFPSEITSLGTAILEITNGVSAITEDFPKEQAFQMLMPAAAFGGLCAIAQTSSVLKGSGLGIIPYVKAKLITAFWVFLASVFL